MTNAGKAIGSLTSDTTGIIGICEGGCGKTGVANICTAGYCACAFDGATTAGDWVQISSASATKCHDAGASRPPSGAIVGRTLSTNKVAGTYSMLVQLQE